MRTPNNISFEIVEKILNSRRFFQMTLLSMTLLMKLLISSVKGSGTTSNYFSYYMLSHFKRRDVFEKMEQQLRKVVFPY